MIDARDVAIKPLFPAHAGMILLRRLPAAVISLIPRTRGEFHTPNICYCVFSAYSPHAWRVPTEGRFMASLFSMLRTRKVVFIIRSVPSVRAAVPLNAAAVHIVVLMAQIAPLCSIAFFLSVITNKHRVFARCLFVIAVCRTDVLPSWQVSSCRKAALLQCCGQFPQSVIRS